MTEEWKDVKGYEGLYQVSNLGRVRSLDAYVKSGRSTTGYRFRKGRILSLRQSDRGYMYVVFGDRKGFQVHRLVALAFIPNPNNLPIINHKDENPSNNTVTNLEWCSHSYNNTYGTAPERRALSMFKPVRCVETDTIYTSVKEASSQTGISDSHIGQVCSGKRYKPDKSHPNGSVRYTAGGYHWEYVT